MRSISFAALSWLVLSLCSCSTFVSELTPSGRDHLDYELGKDRLPWGDGGPIVVDARTYEKGLVTHPEAKDATNGKWAYVEYSLGMRYRTFRAVVGHADDGRCPSKATATYTVFVDGQNRASGPFHDAERESGGGAVVEVGVLGARKIRLEASPKENERDQLGSNYCDHAAWADAQLIGLFDFAKPSSVVP